MKRAMLLILVGALTVFLSAVFSLFSFIMAIEGYLLSNLDINLFYTKIGYCGIAIGIIVMVVGIFIGLFDERKTTSFVHKESSK